jgi:cobalt-zinc-cadmium efflux system protein
VSHRDHDHDHDHGHHYGDRRIGAAVAVNLILTTAQIIGGVLSGSIALIADAIHNLSDALSLIIALFARRIARRPADATMTFGYARAETIAALINYTTLILIGLWLAFEAVLRLFSPNPVDGWIVVILATVALAVNSLTAVLTYTMAKGSMNIRAAFLHNLADALASVGVIIAGTLIILYNWVLIDPLITIAISAYILWHAMAEIGPVIRVLMLGAPPAISADRVLQALIAEPGVTGIHHLHLWQMEESRPAVQAHIALAEGRWSDADAIKDALRGRLAALGISHSTLELECARHPCVDAPLIGHG